MKRVSLLWSAARRERIKLMLAGRLQRDVGLPQDVRSLRASNENFCLADLIADRTDVLIHSAPVPSQA